MSIEYDDSVHGFRKGRGTGTAILQAKLLYQCHYRQNTPLYAIFLDLRKAYDTLDRNRTLRTLRKYGAGRNVLRLIEGEWRDDTLVPRQAGYHGDPLHITRGVRQGDILSPTIFNIMVDSVAKRWRRFAEARMLVEGQQGAFSMNSCSMPTTGS